MGPILRRRFNISLTPMGRHGGSLEELVDRIEEDIPKRCDETK